jgi:ornithine cyclodeaminase/alanine dehydrogenase-like protein (mu-crystallin family)
MGEWHHQPRAARRPAELGEVLRGERPGRRRRDEVVIFDSTGFGLQDACAMAAVLRRLRGHAVPRFDFRANHSPPHR